MEKSQREISKNLGRNKTVICNYLKSPIKYETKKKKKKKKKNDSQARKIITTIQEENCSRSKKENFVNVINVEIK